MTTTDETFELKGELVETHYYHRFPCYTCGGTTEKNAVRCDVHVPSPPSADKPFTVIVCETCLQSGNIDQRMDDHATRLDQYAENLREMRGRLKLPSYAAWQAKCDEVEERNAREREAAERQRGYHVQTESRWFDGDEEVPF